MKYVEMGNKLLVLCFVFIFSIGFVSSTTTSYTSTTTTECNFGVCTATLYSGVQNVLEGDEWIDINRVVSLKDKGVFEIKVIEDDINYPMEILDYNMTSITLDLKQWSLFNKEVDLKIWKKNITKYVDYLQVIEDNQGEDYNGDYKDYYDEIVSDKLIFNIFDFGSKVSVYNIKPGHIIEFGPNSTTVTLQTANSENLDDSWINEGNPNYELYGDGISAWVGQYTSLARRLIAKFNISSLNSSINIVNANHTYNIELNNLDADESYYFDAHHVYQSYSWVESGTGVITWNNRPTTSGQMNLSADSTTTVPGSQTGVITMDTTNMMKRSTGNDDDNLTIYIIPNGGIGIDATEQLLVSEKEAIATAIRPKIEVTYIVGTCTYTSGNWEVNCADNCTISADVDLGGDDITISGAGTFTITGANITNFGNGLVKGENETAQCTVRCLDGGCMNF